MIMQTIIIGIAGPSPSGKTLLANTIVNELNHEKINNTHYSGSDEPRANSTNNLNTRC